ncbi:hypothetical protein PHAVU_004G057200 [Phaseolus vulgaris]|uniref:Uncharacterized protein n=1 Tax=Phaseolus vulgaris TaxID=3885 RepID=V7C3S4_PHAVU|nr:hypothetical protein PHAVU_004G057200g [Phaseolus vulgaris]ESW23556.1 hypothetical protein PHAVU_004G057200g [Phaseolus vulgaris]
MKKKLSILHLIKMSMYSTNHILLQPRCNFNVTQPNIHPMCDTRISISNPQHLVLVREQMFKSLYLHNSCHKLMSVTTKWMGSHYTYELNILNYLHQVDTTTNIDIYSICFHLKSFSQIHHYV